MNNKILLGSIIAVVILVLVSSSSAIDVNYDGNNEIKPVDTTFEIISLITGIGYEFEGDTLNPGAPLFHRNVSIFSDGRQLNIRALTIHPLRLFYNEDVNTIHAKRFIGVMVTITGAFSVVGIALGNIEWS